MAEEFLHGSYVIARFEQMSSKAVTERVTGGRLCDGCAMESFSEGFLHSAIIRVMATLGARARINRT